MFSSTSFSFCGSRLEYAGCMSHSVKQQLKNFLYENRRVRDHVVTSVIDVGKVF